MPARVLLVQRLLYLFSVCVQHVLLSVYSACIEVFGFQAGHPWVFSVCIAMLLNSLLVGVSGAGYRVNGGMSNMCFVLPGQQQHTAVVFVCKAAKNPLRSGYNTSLLLESHPFPPKHKNQNPKQKFLFCSQQPASSLGAAVAAAADHRHICFF